MSELEIREMKERLAARKDARKHDIQDAEVMRLVRHQRQDEMIEMDAPAVVEFPCGGTSSGPGGPPSSSAPSAARGGCALHAPAGAARGKALEDEGFYQRLYSCCIYGAILLCVFGLAFVINFLASCWLWA